jgi:hypothetical protein
MGLAPGSENLNLDSIHPLCARNPNECACASARIGVDFEICPVQDLINEALVSTRVYSKDQKFQWK